MLWWLSQSLVGLVLVFTGAVKALDSGTFTQRVRRYQILSERLVLPLSVALVALECAFGAGLILNVSTWMYPAGILLFAAFIGLNLWGAKARHIDDCGCYGNQVDLTPWQSAALDAVYAAMLGFAWWQSVPSREYLAPRVSAALAIGAVAAAMAIASRSKALVDLRRLRPGVRWKTSWLLAQAGRDFKEGSHLVVFMSQTCSYCKRWVPLLNVLEAQPDLPSVTGILTLSDEELNRFSLEHLIHFPLTRMRRSLEAQMVDGYPTAILLENGIVKERYLGGFPQELAERVEQFLRTVTPSREGAAGRSRFSG